MTDNSEFGLLILGVLVFICMFLYGCCERKCIRGHYYDNYKVRYVKNYQGIGWNIEHYKDGQIWVCDEYGDLECCGS